MNSAPFLSATFLVSLFLSFRGLLIMQDKECHMSWCYSEEKRSLKSNDLT